MPRALFVSFQGFLQSAKGGAQVCTTEYIVLLAEAEVRTHVDIVCTLSPFDEDLEKWMGTRHAAWLPRVVKSNPLPWRPFGRRLGFVGTLDHSPNLEGLVAVLEALGERELAPFNVRVIGGPSEVGAWLAARHACVDYLGAIDDTALAHEAATWSAFLNPIFCQARGCSTKLAMALGWEIPIVTTPQGRRGYVWGKKAPGRRCCCRERRSAQSPSIPRSERRSAGIFRRPRTPRRALERSSAGRCSMVRHSYRGA